MRLKTDRIRNLHDARFCAAEGFSLLGFNLEKGSDTKLSTEMVGEIIGWLSGPSAVLILGEESSGSIAEILASVPASGIQSHSRSSLESQLPDPFIRIGTGDSPEGLSSGVQWQTKFGSIRSLPDSCDTWLEVEPGDDYKAILNLRPYGICFGAGFYEADGTLDYDRIHAFIEEINLLSK